MKTSKEIKENMLKMRKEYMDAAQAEFKEAANELFNKYNRLKSFGLEAFTPYFADGDECIYSAHTDEPYINGVNDWNDNDNKGEGENLYTLGKDSKWDGKNWVANPNIDHEAAEIVDAVKKFLQSFDDDVYKEMFDDHKTITITKDKIEVEDYRDHD